MTESELLAVYGSIRKLAERMEAREAALAQSTAALETAILQVRQLPATLGAQTSQHIGAGIRAVVQEDFGKPIATAVEGPVRSIEMAANHARQAVEQLKEQSSYLNWTWIAVISVLAFALGTFASYGLFAREVSALNDRYDHLEHLLLMPSPVPTDTHAQTPQNGKKHGQH